MVVVVAVAELGLKVCTKLRGLDKEGPRIDSAYPHSPHSVLKIVSIDSLRVRNSQNRTKAKCLLIESRLLL